MNFDKALEENPVPRRVGDVRLHFDSPLLFAEADRASAGLRGPLLFVGGVAAALACGALVLFFDSVPAGPCLALALAAAAQVGAGAVLEDRARRRRRFALDFDGHTLRLDFTLPPAGLPRSLVLPFSRVLALNVLEQADGFWTLTVDVEPSPGAGPLREVLVANVRPAEAEALGWLHRLLDGAFDLATTSPG
ncbi:MAG: hypothetical protein ACYC8T_09005 [Myxococcaceae bacterium]